MQIKCRKEVVTITKITYNKNDTKRKRKIIRIQGYDYSKEGLYFITICTEGRKEILSKINTETKYYIHRQNRDNNVGADDPVRPQLKTIGKIVNDRINDIERIYANIKIHKYIIMPNHVHMIIEIENGRTESSAPTKDNTRIKINNNERMLEI